MVTFLPPLSRFRQYLRVQVMRYLPMSFRVLKGNCFNLAVFIVECFIILPSDDGGAGDGGGDCRRA